MNENEISNKNNDLIKKSPTRSASISENDNNNSTTITVSNLDQLLNELESISTAVKNYENKIFEFQKIYSNKIVNQEADINLIKKDIEVFQNQGIKFSQHGIEQIFGYSIKLNNDDLSESKLNVQALLAHYFHQLDSLVMIVKDNESKINHIIDFNADFKNDFKELINEQEKNFAIHHNHLKDEIQSVKNQQQQILNLLELNQKNTLQTNNSSQLKSNDVLDGAYYGFKVFEELTVMARSYAEYQEEIQKFQDNQQHMESINQQIKSDTEFELLNKYIVNLDLDADFEKKEFLKEYLQKDTMLYKGNTICLNTSSIEQFKDKITNIQDGNYTILKSCFYLKSNSNKIIQQAELDLQVQNEPYSPNF